MRVGIRTPLITCGLLAFAPDLASAGAGALNLGWDDCGGLPASENRTFACNTNQGTNTLVGSFLAPCCVTAAYATEFTLDLQSASAELPPWWSFRSGFGCRGASLTSSYNFTGGPFTCFDFYKGGASGGAMMPLNPVGNRGRIVGLGVLPFGVPVGPIPEGTEAYSFKCIVNNARSTGLGSCQGCGTGVCIVLNSIRIGQLESAPGGFKFVSAPGVRNWVTWQGGIGADCYLATPVRNTTWGSVKTLYH